MKGDISDTSKLVFLSVYLNYVVKLLLRTSSSVILSVGDCLRQGPQTYLRSMCVLLDTEVGKNSSWISWHVVLECTSPIEAIVCTNGCQFLLIRKDNKQRYSCHHS